MKNLLVLSLLLAASGTGACGEQSGDRYYTSMTMYVLPEQVAKGLLSGSVDEARLKKIAPLTIVSKEISYIGSIVDGIAELPASDKCTLKNGLRWIIEVSNEEEAWQESYVSDGLTIMDSTGKCRKATSPLDFDIAGAISRESDRTSVY